MRFPDPSLGSFGDVSLNSLQGPDNKNFDFALEKMIPLRESPQLELRTEVFNVLNHPNFLFAPLDHKTQTMRRFSEHRALAL
jgi:hypothetical protein